MKLAMEIPFAHLEELSEVCDFDFALTHLVLELGPDHPYVKFYKKQSERGREVWLDNSTHEKAKSCTTEEILKAAEMIGATHVVAPEVRRDWVTTERLVATFVELVHQKNLPYKVVGTCHGGTKALKRLLRIVDKVAMPFDSMFLRDRIALAAPQAKIHYFGFRSVKELQLVPPDSIDTSIPIRAVLWGVNLFGSERRPKLPPLDFNIRLSAKQVETVKKVVMYLKCLPEQQK